MPAGAAATVIDSLVVELGLDARKFTEGRREAQEAFQKTKTEVTAFTKTIEDSGTKVSDVFSVMKKGIFGVVAGLVGGEAASFIQSIVTADAGLGRLSKSIGVNIETMSMWRNMARAVGGSASEADSTLSTLADTFQRYKAFQEQPEGNFASLINRSGADWRAGPDVFIKQVSAYLEREVAAGRMTEQERRREALTIPGVAGSPAMLNLIIGGAKAVDKAREAVEKFGGATELSAEAAADLQLKEAALATAFDEIARITLPFLARVVNKIAEMLHIDAEEGGSSIFTAKRGSFADWVLTMGGRYPLPKGSYADEHPGATPGGIFNAFGRQTRGDRNNNPGNIKMGPDARAFGATGQDDQGHAIFPTKEAGDAAQASLLRRLYSGMTIAQMGMKYAEDPHWAAGVAAAGGYGLGDVPNMSDPAQMARLQRAIRQQEGTHFGGGGADIWGSAPKPGFYQGPMRPQSSNNSNVTVGAINITSHKADPQAVADLVPGSLRRFATARNAEGAQV